MKVFKLITPLILAMFFCISLSYAKSAGEYYKKGVEYGMSGDFKAARAEFKKIFKNDPFYTSAKNCLEIIEDIDKQKIKKEAAIHIFKGVDFYNRGMLKEAIAEDKKAIKISPAYARAHYNLGVDYYKSGMFDKAIAEYKTAIKINPAYSDAHNNLGLAYYDNGMVNEAIAEYQKAIKIKPAFAEAHYNLGIAYYMKKKYNLAIQYYDKAILLGFKPDPEFSKALEPYRKKK